MTTEVTQLLDVENARDAIWNGGWLSVTQTMRSYEPATGETLAIIGAGSFDDVGRAAGAAAEAQPSWAARPPAERGAVLARAAAILDEKRAEVERWLVREGGGSQMKAAGEIDGSVAELREAADLSTRETTLDFTDAEIGRRSVMRRVPIGVVGVITPWNFPLVLALRSVAPALALGNAVVLKPDPNTPVSGGLVLARLLQAGGLPSGCLHVVPGGADAGEAICSAPEIGMVSFTGSTRAGRKVGARAGENLKRVALELGGNSADIVLDDADIDAASSAGAFGSFFHQGQICMASSRHIVHEKVAGQYLEALTARAQRLTVGDLTDADVQLGPMINAQQYDRVTRILEDSISAGARLIAGGTGKTPFFPSTVVCDVTVDMPVWRQEIFGPIAPVMTFATDDEAIALSSDTEYGLSAGIYTPATERGRRIAEQLRTGMTHLGDQTVNDGPATPFGGVGASGNGGRFGGPASIEEFTQWRWMTERNVPAVYPF